MEKINKVLVAIQEYQNDMQVILNYSMVKSSACIWKPLRTAFLVVSQQWCSLILQARQRGSTIKFIFSFSVVN